MIHKSLIRAWRLKTISPTRNYALISSSEACGHVETHGISTHTAFLGQPQIFRFPTQTQTFWPQVSGFCCPLNHWLGWCVLDTYIQLTMTERQAIKVSSKDSQVSPHAIRIPHTKIGFQIVPIAACRVGWADILRTKMCQTFHAIGRVIVLSRIFLFWTR
jgi:hypothetical protein